MVTLRAAEYQCRHEYKFAWKVYLKLTALTAQSRYQDHERERELN